jgi:hypothetical protein
VMNASTNCFSHFNEEVENYQENQISGAVAGEIRDMHAQQLKYLPECGGKKSGGSSARYAGCKICQERSYPES